MENGEQTIVKENKVLSTNLPIEIENRKVELLINYCLDQQIFKFKVNSGKNLELWGVNVDFKSYQTNGQFMEFFNLWVSIIQMRILVL